MYLSRLLKENPKRVLGNRPDLFLLAGAVKEIATQKLPQPLSWLTTNYREVEQLVRIGASYLLKGAGYILTSCPIPLQPVVV